MDRYEYDEIKAIYKYIYTKNCIQHYIHKYIYMCIYIYMCDSGLYIYNAYICSNLYVYMYIYMYIAHLYINMITYIYIYIYIYISTTPRGAIPRHLLADGNSQRRVERADSSDAEASRGGATNVAAKKKHRGRNTRRNKRQQQQPSARPQRDNTMCSNRVCSQKLPASMCSHSACSQQFP